MARIEVWFKPIQKYLTSYHLATMYHLKIDQVPKWPRDFFHRSERGEDARAPVPDQQVRTGPRYPVDRYLVESSKIEMVNIIDEDIWNPEPALRPEEEIILRKLHDMLQSTADDLKLLSGELVQRGPGTRVRPPPAPLDDEFNEKVHIEEVVNAKFHGYKIVDKTPQLKTETISKNDINAINNDIQNKATIKKPTNVKQLTKSRTRIVQIDAADSTKEEKVDVTKKPNKETVIYNEFTFQYPAVNNDSFVKDLKVQAMPSINIRGELKEQKVLHLDIQPEPLNIENKSEIKHNVGVISVQHEIPPAKTPAVKISQPFVTSKLHTTHSKKPARKVTKIVTCESSTSTNNLSSDQQYNLDITSAKPSSKTTVRSDRNKINRNTTAKAETPKRPHLNLDEWKKKLNSVYGQPSTSKKNKIPQKSKGVGKKISPKKSNVPISNVSKPQPKLLNNAQYIPYSQLTLGGVNVSDIEKKISNIPNKSNIPLSPILDRILSSQENSRDNSPRKKDQLDSQKILTTSDENLLREVIDIEKTVSKTLSKNTEIRVKDKKSQSISSDNGTENTNEPDSYVDDFEDEKSDKSDKHSQASQLKSDTKSTDKASNNETAENSEEEHLKTPKSKTNSHNTTYTKVPNLSLKKRVDVFEFVHEINTQDTATQSQTTNKISLKETQTSPRNTSPNISVQPIHNDLWPMDPSKQIEKLFKLEKALIKKLIIDEYGDLLQSSIDKPSTSKEKQDSFSASLNVNASQKVTQTSPKHAKSVMTSPTHTKTRTTSPFPLSVPVDHQTSPIIYVTKEKDHKVEIEQEPEDLGISINLSSPRFSLRLPNTSVEVLSNLEICSRSPTKREVSKRSTPKPPRTVMENLTSSTSIDADNSSSEISSLGEIKLKLKRRLRKSRVSSSSESSSSLSSMLSIDFNSAGILPLRSEGELTISSMHRSRSRSGNVPSKSEGEISFGKK